MHLTYKNKRSFKNYITDLKHKAKKETTEIEELILATLDEVIKLLRQFGKELDETKERLNQIQPSEREIEIKIDPKMLGSAVHHSIYDIYHDIQNESE